MIDKRQPVRRCFTGGIALGFFAGILLAVPDLIGVFFNSDSGTASVIFAFDLSLGILGGGVAGLIYGLFIVLAERFAENRDHRFILRRNAGTVFAALWFLYFSSVLNASVFVKLGVFVFSTAIFYFLLGLIMKFSMKIVAGYVHDFSAYTYIGLFLVTGLIFSWSKGPQYFISAPVFWVTISLTLHLFALFLLFNLIRYKSRQTLGGRQRLSILATPKFIVFFLFVSAFSVTWTKLKKNVYKQRLSQHSSLIYSLMFGKTYKPNSSEFTVNSVSADRKKVFFNIPENASVVYITASGKLKPEIAGGWTNEYTVLPSLNKEDIFGTLFLSKHMGLRRETAPFVSAPLPSVPQFLKLKKHYFLYHLSMDCAFKTSSYYRELPFYGFPTPVCMNINDVKNVLETISFFKRPFILWMNIAERKINIAEIINQINKIGIYTVLFVASSNSKFAYVNVSGPEIPSFKDSGFYPLDALSASLFRTKAALADQPSFKFPPSGRLAVFISDNTRIVYSTDGKFLKNYNSLKYKIKKKLRKFLYPSRYLSLSSTKQKIILKLEHLICKGWTDKKEKKELNELKLNPYLDKQVKLRLDILDARLGTKKTSLLISNEFFNYFNKVVLPVFHKSVVSVNSEIKNKNLMIDWIYFINTGIKTPSLYEKCPGLF